MSTENNPVVSIIVPARNEEASLRSCLESLIAQTGTDFEIIVVDDASTDRTAEIARSFVSSNDSQSNPSPGEDPSASLRAGALSSTVRVGADALVRPDIHVISAGPLPDNWTGKNNAMTAGAKLAKGKWLLFTDADTVHKPGSLARAVAEAEQHGAALLSYSPEQEVHGFWEKAVMPVIFAELASTYPPQAVNDPASPIAAANGQYLLISREAYDAVGGHAAIANNLLEDVAMARLVKSSGRKIFFRYGGDAVRTRMYRTFAQMREGWTKNLALLFPQPIELAPRRFGEFVLLLVLPWVIARGTYWRAFSSVLPSVWLKWYIVVVGAWAFAAFILSASEFLLRMRKAHFSRWNTAFAFFGLPIFAYLLLRSEWSFKRSRFDWKDRTYIYTPEEVKTLSAARLRLDTPGTWRKLTARIWNHGDT